MSLGSPYGQPEDDATYYANQLVQLGVIVVASAGNSADKPFIMGSPSLADGVISVAQTTMPSAVGYLNTPAIDAPAAIKGPLAQPVLQPWSPTPTKKVSGTVIYGDGTNNTDANKDGCAAFTPAQAANVAGKVVLVDRGDCSISVKSIIC
jgi:hypothetical protein